LKLHTLIGCFACVLGLTTWSHAQAVPAASKPSRLQLGAGFTYARPDYSTPIKGISAYGDFDFTHHLGIEGDLHFVKIWTPADIAENSYLVGPRVKFQFGRLTPYAKALGGIGQFQYQYPSQFPKATSYTYGVYAFGGGLDYHASRHLNIRPFDIEFQKWPGFRPNGLTPIVMTFGAAYAF
jgi:hypothetical protein